jgi:hypothetical protein
MKNIKLGYIILLAIILIVCACTLITSWKWDCPVEIIAKLPVR